MKLGIMREFLITIGCVFGYFILSMIAALILVYALFLKKKKPGALSAFIMGISKNKLKEIVNSIKENKAWFENTPHEKLYITSYDSVKLKARYYSCNSKKTVVCIHGYLGSYDIDFSQIAPMYYNNGYNVLLLNNRAHGKSGGRFIGFSHKDKFDLLYWLNTFDKMVNQEHDLFVHGISMGAATSINVIGPDVPKSLKGIISDCGFLTPIEQIKYLLKKFCPIALFPLYQFFLLFTKLITGNDFSKDNALDSLKKTRLPFLFIHGKNDFFVPLFMSKSAYTHCAGEKVLEIFNNAGHAASQHVDFNRYRKISLDFLSKYSSN